MRILLAALAAILLGACQSESTVTSSGVTEGQAASGHRRAEVHTALAG